MQVVLAMFKSDGQRRSFSLHKESTVIGRREDCDLRIPLGEISRKHCRLIQDGDSLRLEDMGSSNGTFHNGQRVQEAVLQAGDTLQLGSIAFVVQIDGVPADEELQPVLATPAAEPMSSEDSGALPAEGDDSATDEASTDSGTGEPVEASSSSNAGDFDPMAVLQGGDIEGSGTPIDIDLDQSAHGQDSEA